MGCTFNNEPDLHASLKRINRDRILHVASLNYCGILKSPFEFYSGQFHQELKTLSLIFEKLKSKYVKIPTDQPFAWQFGKLDKKVKQKRYCPLYNLLVGIVNDKFVSKATFTKLWQEMIQKVQKQQKVQFTTLEKEEALRFDLLSYHALLNYVYKVQDIDQMENKSPELYLKTFQPFFDQAFLDENKKISKFIEGLQTTLSDIIFIQEGNEQLVKALSRNSNNHVEISSDKDTLICIRKDRFKNIIPAKIFTNLAKEELTLLDWNNHSTIMMADNYLLISGHLSSNKKINAENIQTLKKGYQMLKEKHPQYEVICGIDVNSFLGKFDNHINVFPKEQNEWTSLKMRTSMQTQSNKAEVISKESKDAIMTTLPIIDGQISTIALVKPSQTTFLPDDNHPFDHFLVFAKICVDREKQSQETNA